MSKNQFYRPISRDYEYLGASLKNTRNSWGAYSLDLTNIVLTGWTDHFDQESMRIIASGSGWKRTRSGRRPGGYKERQRHLDAIDSGIPFYMLVATDKHRGQGDERKIDPHVPRLCYKGIGLEQEGDTTYAILGNEIDLVHLQAKFIHEKDRLKEKYLKGRAREAGLDEPVIDEVLIARYEREVKAKRAPRNLNKPRSVYIISQPEGGNHFKVGLSKNPVERLAQLQTGNPFKLELEANSVTMPAIEAFAWETLIHNELPNRLMGEWFEAGSIDTAAQMAQSIYGGLLFESEVANPEKRGIVNSIASVPSLNSC